MAYAILCSSLGRTTCKRWSPLHGAGDQDRLPSELSATLHGSLQACWHPQLVSATWGTMQTCCVPGHHLTCLHAAFRSNRNCAGRYGGRTVYVRSATATCLIIPGVYSVPDSHRIFANTDTELSALSALDRWGG